MSEQRITTPRPLTLDIRVPSGEVSVATVTGEESVVIVDGSQRAVDATTVELVGDRLLIQQRHKPLGGLLGRFDASLRIQANVPHKTSVAIATASGDATLDGTFASLQMKSASGGLLATGEIQGDASVELVSGDVRLPRVTGDLTTRTVSGDIAAEVVEGSVSAKSVSGDVRVGTLRQGTATVRSVSGGVDLGIAAGTSVDVDASSASGKMTSEIPLAPAPDGEPGPTLVIRGNTVSGDFRVFRAA